MVAEAGGQVLEQAGLGGSVKVSSSITRLLTVQVMAV